MQSKMKANVNVYFLAYYAYYAYPVPIGIAYQIYISTHFTKRMDKK